MWIVLYRFKQNPGTWNVKEGFNSEGEAHIWGMTLVSKYAGNTLLQIMYKERTMAG